MYAHVEELQETVLKARKQEWLLVCKNLAEKKKFKKWFSQKKDLFL